MRTEQIVYLKEIAKVKSLNLASKNLCISVQALCKSVKRLEEEVGYKILRTTYSGSQLTDEGEDLLDAGLDFLDKIERIGVQTSGKRQLEAQAYAFACLPGVIEIILPQFFIEFERFHKNCVLSPMVVTYPQMEEKLLSEAWEYIFCFEPWVSLEPTMTWSEEFEFVALKKLQFYCGVNEKLMVGKHKNITLKEFGKYDLIVLDAPDCVPTQSILKKLFPQKTIKAFQYRSLYTRTLMETKSACLTLGMEGMIDQVEGVAYIPIVDKGLWCNFGYVKRKDKLLGEEAQLFLEMLQEFLAIYG